MKAFCENFVQLYMVSNMQNENLDTRLLLKKYLMFLPCLDFGYSVPNTRDVARLKKSVKNTSRFRVFIFLKAEHNPMYHA